MEQVVGVGKPSPGRGVALFPGQRRTEIAGLRIGPLPEAAAAAGEEAPEGAETMNRVPVAMCLILYRVVEPDDGRIIE